MSLLKTFVTYIPKIVLRRDVCIYMYMSSDDMSPFSKYVVVYNDKLTNKRLSFCLIHFKESEEHLKMSFSSDLVFRGSKDIASNIRQNFMNGDLKFCKLLSSTFVIKNDEEFSRFAKLKCDSMSSNLLDFFTYLFIKETTNANLKAYVNNYKGLRKLIDIKLGIPGMIFA